MFWKNFFSNGPPLVLRSPLKFFFDQFWKFFNYASNCFENMKKRFLSSKQSFSNHKNRFWTKFFFPMVPPLVLRSPLKFFFDQFWKFFNYASNSFKIWKNVFFHQNNHFQIIKTCFEKIFFQWSPLWSWGHPLNFFSHQFWKFFNMLQIVSKYEQNVFFHQNNHFQIIKHVLKKIFFPMVPPLVLRSPLKFFSTSFENFSTMLQIVLKIWKNVFFHQNNHFQIIKTCFEKIFFPMVPPLVLRSPLKFFFDQFWKFFNYASNCFKIWKNRFLSSKQSFSNHKNVLKKIFFPMVPPLVLRSPLKFFFDQFWKFFNYASNSFKIWKNVFFHQNNHFQIIKTCFEKKFFPMVPPLVLRSPLKFFFDQFWKFFNYASNSF